jgi:hypothetical protein
MKLWMRNKMDELFHECWQKNLVKSWEKIKIGWQKFMLV